MVMFWILVGLFEVLSLIALVLAGVWVDTWLEGVAWDGSSSEFNLHPILMTLGLIVFNGNAILLYRMLRYQPKKWVKIGHAVMQALALFCASLALAAVWQNHVVNGTANAYSIHSWVGLVAFTLFALQWFIGFFSFLWPGARMGVRESYKPLHVFFGIFIFAASCAAALIGIEDKVMNSFSDTYSDRTAEGYVANFFGMSIFAAAGVLSFAATWPDWKRQEIGESQPLVSHSEPAEVPLEEP